MAQYGTRSRLTRQGADLWHHWLMARTETTVVLDDEVLARLRRAADRAGLDDSAVVWSYLTLVDSFRLDVGRGSTPASAPSEAGWLGSAGPKGPRRCSYNSS